MDRQTIDKMTDQELANATQAAIWRAVRLANRALRRACGAADASASAAAVVPHVAHMASALLAAHGHATTAANLMPGVQPQFGGKD